MLHTLKTILNYILLFNIYFIEKKKIKSVLLINEYIKLIQVTFRVSVFDFLKINF